MHVWEIAKRLVVDHGCKVDIITRKLLADGGERGVDNESHLDGNLRVIRLGPISKFDNFFGRLWFLVRSFFYLLSSYYDIVNAQAFLPAIPAKFSSRFTRTPIIFTVHGTGLGLWYELQKGIVGRLKSFIEWVLLLKVRYDKVVSVSEDFLQYPNVNKYIKVIHNGVDMDAFDDIQISKSSKEKIIFVGRLHPQKGLTYLIKAMKRVIDKRPNAELHIIGTGEQENMLRQLVNDLRLQKNIFFCGKFFGDDLTREYLSSHLFVLPSVYEGQPLTLLEAWAAKLPIVATRVGGIPSIVEEGVDGLLVEPKDDNALAKAILDCLYDHEKGRQMGMCGYEKIKKNFSWEKTASMFFDLYSHALNVNR